MVVRYQTQEAAGAQYIETTATVDAADEFCEAIELKPGRSAALSISGTFSSDITVQRSYDSGSTWLDVESFDEPVQKIIDKEAIGTGGELWRAGFKSDAAPTGSAVVLIRQTLTR